MAIALGPQRAREFQAMLHAESIMQKLKEAVQGNSSTVMQLLGAGAAGAAGGGYLGFDPTTSGITGALAGGLKKGADANMARHITRLMMSRDPAVLQAGIRQLARNGRNLERLQSLSNALARVTGEQAGERIPGRQAGGPVEEDQPYLVGERAPRCSCPTIRGRGPPPGPAAEAVGRALAHVSWRAATVSPPPTARSTRAPGGRLRGRQDPALRQRVLRPGAGGAAGARRGWGSAGGAGAGGRSARRWGGRPIARGGRKDWPAAPEGGGAYPGIYRNPKDIAAEAAAQWRPSIRR